ncbi:MAG TPA: hypothetical protein VG498_07875 [Terriglobales bacterium]|nr:hypothetical protein [Terriglobales bacterium]
MNDRTSRVVFSALLFVLTLIAYLTPYYDWDLVAYVGSAIALHEYDSRAIQHEAYSALERELSQEDYTDIASGSDFRREVAQNPDSFRQQLRFYQIRPLYIWLLAALHAAGLGFVAATRVISAAAFLLIGAVLFFFMCRYVKDSHATIAVLLLLITPVLFTSARTGSPDAISALVVLTGTFAIVERDHLLFGAALLLLSLALRTDNIIFALLLFASVALVKTSSKARVITACAAVLAVAVVLTINRTQHSYPWSVLLRNTESPIVNPAENSSATSIVDYFSAMHDMIDEARENSVTVFPLIAALCLLSFKTSAHLKRLVKVVLLSWLAHILIFPHIEDRYFIAGAAIIGVAAVTAVLSRNQTEKLPVAT